MRNKTISIVLFIIASVDIPIYSQDLRLTARVDGAYALPSLSTVSAFNFGGAIGAEVENLFLPGLTLGLDLGYDSFTPSVDWIESLGQANALARVGYRFPLEPITLTPQAILGVGYLFSQASYSNATYESYDGILLLTGAGVAADYALSKSLSLRATLDWKVLAESGGLYSTLSLNAGVSWKSPGSLFRSRPEQPAVPVTVSKPPVAREEISTEPEIPAAPVESSAEVESQAPAIPEENAALEPMAEEMETEPVQAVPAPAIEDTPTAIAEEPPIEQPKPDAKAELARTVETLSSELAEYPNIRVKEDAGGVRLVLEGTFEPNTAFLTEKTRNQLARVARAADGMKPVRIIIRGYAAKDGNPDTDKPVSEARADAVRIWLEANEYFAGAAVETLGMGSADPVGDDGTAAGRERNRRVEIEIHLDRKGE